MLAQLLARGARMGAARARRRRDDIAARLAATAPPGVRIARDGETVAAAGRGLARRFDKEPALRWWLMEGRDGE